MDAIRSTRSLAKPRRTVRSPKVLRGYADLHRHRPCEWCAEDGGDAAFEELHHILGGARKEDADWNVVAICRWHHQHPVHGFHGSAPQWDHARAFALKLAQGYELPAEAWGFLPEGRDACPTPEPSQEHNRAVTAALCA